MSSDCSRVVEYKLDVTTEDSEAVLSDALNVKQLLLVGSEEEAMWVFFFTESMLQNLDGVITSLRSPRMPKKDEWRLRNST